jgi:hypothetical protein
MGGRVGRSKEKTWKKKKRKKERNILFNKILPLFSKNIFMGKIWGFVPTKGVLQDLTEVLLNLLQFAVIWFSHRYFG